MYLRFRGTLPCGVRVCHFTSLDTLAAEFYEHTHPHTTDRKECIH